MDEPDGPPSLDFLLDYLTEVFRTLTNPAASILITPANGAQSSGYMPMEHTGPDFDSVAREVDRCMQVGLLRQEGHGRGLPGARRGVLRTHLVRASLARRWTSHPC